MAAGLKILVRELKLTVSDSPVNRKRAQVLIEAFSEMWADEFPAFCEPMAESKPIKTGVRV